ncbi:MAG TPA: arylsulfotransferase family protein [Solirubrobacteraceae bacterium]|jgi:hypothetical protein
MRRSTNGSIALASAVVAAVSLAACGGSGGSGASASGAAPNCLPKTLVTSATLPGTSVDVTPAPGSVSASPKTQISFLGAPASEIHDVAVKGSQTGSHRGRLAAYSQGDGASFLPSKPFLAGEHVSVSASIGSGQGKPVAFSFTVDTPDPAADVKPFGNPAAPAADSQSFLTMPGMQAPVLTVTHADEDPQAGDVFTSNGPGPGRYGALIYNPQGRLIWFDQMKGEEVADDVNVQEYEGHEDLTMWQGRVPNLGFGEGEDLILDNRYQVIAHDRGGNGLKPDLHDFELAGNDVAYNTAFNPIHCNLTSAEGEGESEGELLDAAVQEVDLKTGLVRWEWHALDHISVNESETAAPAGRAWDWFHINSIDPQPDGNVFISSRNTWAGYQLEGGSGRILWRLGGLKSSFEMGPGTKTAWQHDGRVLPNGEVTFYDDGANPVEHSQSRAVRIALDMQSKEARLTSQITHPGTPLLAASQGNVQTLGNGNIVVGWGGVPYVSELSASGKLLFDAHFSPELIFYRAYRHSWSARPATPPALLANLNNTGEETIVHMSWNGATEVASWRVLAGKSASALSEQTTVPVSGFETTTILAKKGLAYVQAQALNADGETIGSSHTVRAASFKSSLAKAVKEE